MFRTVLVNHILCIVKCNCQINSQNILYSDADLPKCKYRAYIFYEVVDYRTWKMRFTVVQDTTYSQVINSMII